MLEFRHARYQGRHRTPSTARTLSAAGAVGVGAVAITALAPMAGAHAAGAGSWEKVASCESSGNWAADTGNGYYGGLQFSPGTWAGYGGRSYAAEASGASESQQIVVANRVLASQGWGAWPVCSRVAGVTGEPTASGVDTSSADVASTATPATPHTAHSETYVPHVKGAHYTVKSGDSLSLIASEHHVAGGWESIYQANKQVIGSNPSLIRPGMKLKV